MRSFFTRYFRSCNRLVLGSLLLMALILQTGLGRGAAAGAFADTPSQPIVIQRTLFILPTLKILSTPVILPTGITKFSMRNLATTKVSDDFFKTTADLNNGALFSGSLDMVYPSEIPTGGSKTITLRLTCNSAPEGSMLQPELLVIADKFAITPLIQLEQPASPNSTLEWGWVVAPLSNTSGSQELLLYIYLKKGGSTAVWDAIPIPLVIPATPTPIPTFTWTPSQTPSDTPIWTSTPTYTPTPLLPTPFMTPTFTFYEKTINSIAENAVPCIAAIVTLLLGLLGVYFQYIRKGGKKSDN